QPIVATQAAAPAPVAPAEVSTASAVSAGEAQQQHQQADSKSAKAGERADAGRSGEVAEATAVVDYTELPPALEKQYELLDVDGALRPTIINPGLSWSKSSKKSLLAEPTTATLGTAEQGKERSRAFDLLDALTKSGELTLEHAALHVVIA